VSATNVEEAGQTTGAIVGIELPILAPA
jgi:hypothetical protein